MEVGVAFTAWLDRLVLDVRLSIRVLGKAPMFAGIAVLSLGLGIGANTAIFTIVHALMLKALPVAEPERLVQVVIGRDQTTFTNPIWEAIRDRQPIFDGMVAFSHTRFDLASGGEKQFIDGAHVNGEYFRALGVGAFAGRLLTSDDDRRDGGAHGPVAVLGYAYWRDHYHGSHDALGRTIRLDGHAFTIVGVTPPGFFGVNVGSRVDVTVPISAHVLIRGKDHALDRRTMWWLRVFGRLKPGLSIQQAEVNIRALVPQIREATMPDQYVRQQDRDAYLKESLSLVSAASGHSYLRDRYRTALLTLMVAVGLVLLIACANLANLLLARASARQKEFAVRLALGASRARLVRQLLTESVLLSSAGALLGVLFARWASALLVRQIARGSSPIFLDLSIDTTILLFTIGVAVVTAAIFGLAPAFRSTDLNAHALLKGSSRSVVGSGWNGFSLEKLLVVVQIAVSLVLVCGAALLVRSFASLATLDPGFDRRQVLVVNIDARQANYPPERRAAEFRRILDALRELAGVHSAAETMITPISGSTWTDAGFVPGKESLSHLQRRVFMNRVSPGYFGTLGTPIYAGRDISEIDTQKTPAVALVNEAFARVFFDGDNPVGRTFDVPDFTAASPDRYKRYHVVGFVKDSKFDSLRKDVAPTAFVAMAQDAIHGVHATFVVRGTSDKAALVSAVTTAVRGIHRDLALEFELLDTILKDSLAQERLIAILSGFFGALALLVAGIGLYGVMSLAVSRRRSEIGIRMALGARPASVVRMIVWDVAIVTAIGLAIGGVSGVLSGRLFSPLLFGIEPSDGPTWVMTITTLGAAAAVAGYLPARRASRLDPMIALREE
jgi:putative ABC transport system permease protein